MSAINQSTLTDPPKEKVSWTAPNLACLKIAGDTVFALPAVFLFVAEFARPFFYLLRKGGLFIS